MSHIEIITTTDGSHSLRNIGLNETYHSIHGAIQESVHVFISHGLVFFENQNHPSEIRILEVGFGTGLNVLLTVKHALGSNVRFSYTSLDPDPLPEEIIQQLNYPEILDFEGAASFFQTIHAARWTREEVIWKNFILEKQRVRLQDADLGNEQFDLVYFDAFAPSKQPELWAIDVLKKVERSMKPRSVFVTYCAKGQFKRDLQSLGFQVQALPGPPGKKEMVRALKC